MNMGYNRYMFAADVILFMHLAFVVFVVFGLVLIWIGYCLKLRYTQNATFRIAHLSAMGIVLFESLAGMICPLTEWESDLRLKAGQGQTYETGFVRDWVHKIMFFDFSEQTFTIVYMVFFLLIMLTFRIIPPKKDSKRK